METDFLEVKFASDSVDAETGSFSGYGAVFGNVDSYGDVIVPGAFKASLKDWKREKTLPPMLAQHGGWMMTDMDAIPVGVWTDMEEDDVGLKVAGRIINLDTERGKTIRGAMKEGALNGLSIGYRAKKFTLGTKPDEPRRKLEVIDLAEVSVVTFPANRRALVDRDSVKSANLMTKREFEEGLMRGTLPKLSARQAKALLSGGFKAAFSERDAGDDTDILAALRRNLDILKGN